MFIENYDVSRHYTLEVTETYFRNVVALKYDKLNTEQIFKALAISEQAHLGHCRYDDTPYVVHPIRVALMLLKFDENIATSKVIIAALLHDTLEKKCLSSEEIEDNFGHYVLKLVISITRCYDSLSLEEAKRAKLRYLQEMMSGSHEVMALKTYENLDNIISWKTISVDHPAFKNISCWLEEAVEIFLPLAHATNRKAYSLMQQEIASYVEYSRR